MTDGAKPATRKSLAKEEALKSFSVVADGWAGAEQNEDETAVPVVRMPETKPAKAELLTPAQKRQIWEKSRYEALRQQPDAMAFHEEALARFEQDGMLKKLAKTNGLTEDEARRVWSVFLEHHRIRTTAQAAGGRAEIEECPEADSDIEGKDALQTAKPSAQPERDEKEAGNDRPPIQITKMPTPPLPAVSTEQTSEPATTENITLQPLREESVERSEKQDTKELRYRINDEIAQQELARTQAAAAELASQADDEIRRARWSSVKTVTNRTAMGIFALGLLGAGAMALNVWDLRERLGIHLPAVLQPAPDVAVVDRQAARKALLELAGRAALEDVMAANDVFDELFVLASARVAARENWLLIDARAVVAMASGGRDATERIEAEIVNLVQNGAIERIRKTAGKPEEGR